MQAINNYADQRFNGKCVYCGAAPETREHVPPKVFLDRKFPENLPIVEACSTCNNGFSADEEYMACLIECSIAGSADPDLLQRSNIAKTLIKRPALRQRLQNSMRHDAGQTLFSIEQDRVCNVVKKVAVGHVLFELNLLLSESPKVYMAPFASLSEEQKDEFENIDYMMPTMWPEVGSRAMQRLLIVEDCVYDEGWVVVQSNRYRYAVIQSEVIEVRMVFSEYLACQVIWEVAA
ncbi:hypothetical protein ACFLQY_03840 [Verrucomicrobiota bacterium]